ncbi:MAG TPA: thioredoxin domain-containing protein [Myxococcaceae bacterium]|nr:thioredoxin domain-containing protein [Myxococcaceae bacterium]
MKVSAFLTLLVGLVVGIAIGRATSSTAPTTVAQRPGTPPARQRPAADTTVFRLPIEDSPVRGPADALVTVVEFSDYQCPFCRQANATVTQVEKKYAGKVRLIMKQFPLVSLHPQAMPAARAAVAAGMQGRYWEMHDRLFASPQLDSDTLEHYAREVGLDVERWKRDQNDPKVAAIIQRDMDLATNVNVTGTPAFFVNGRRLPGGAAPLDAFSSLIDEELAKAEGMVRQGVPAAQVYAKLQEKAVASAVPPPVVKKVDTPADSPSFGPTMAKVTIVEWSDFQCPYCARAAPIVEQIRQAYPKDVRFVFRHLPLPMHPDAPLAARAGVAAQAQGKFWQMHDWMYAHQHDLKEDQLVKAAASFGMDVARFKAALADPATEARVGADRQAASAVGVSATPTFFVNGREHVGGIPFEQLKVEIDREIARADKLLSSGVKPADLYGRLVADSAGPSGARN